MLENKKRSARDLNKPTTHGHLIIVFVPETKTQTNNGGFKPPQNTNVKNSD